MPLAFKFIDYREKHMQGKKRNDKSAKEGRRKKEKNEREREQPVLLTGSGS